MQKDHIASKTFKKIIFFIILYHTIFDFIFVVFNNDIRNIKFRILIKLKKNFKKNWNHIQIKIFSLRFALCVLRIDQSNSKFSQSIWIRHSNFIVNQSKIFLIANFWCKQNFKFYKFDHFIIDFNLFDIDDIINLINQFARSSQTSCFSHIKNVWSFSKIDFILILILNY